MSKIITASDLQSYKGETLDSGRAGQVVAAVNASIEHSTGRVWGEEKTVEAEAHDYAPVIFLRNMDVTEVSKIERGYPQDDDELLQPTSYRWNSLGRVVLGRRDSRSLIPGYDEVFVTYKHGVATVPDDLKLAALSLASGFYDYASDGDTEVSAERIGSYSLTYTRGQASSSGQSLASIINSYRQV